MSRRRDKKTKQKKRQKRQQRKKDKKDKKIPKRLKDKKDKKSKRPKRVFYVVMSGMFKTLAMLFINVSSFLLISIFSKKTFRNILRMQMGQDIKKKKAKALPHIHIFF